MLHLAPNIYPRIVFAFTLFICDNGSLGKRFLDRPPDRRTAKPLNVN